MYYENITDFSKINAGDIIKHKADHRKYIVTANFGNRITAVKTIDATNPIEWEVFNRSGENRNQTYD
jgi:hypothetical protein